MGDYGREDAYKAGGDYADYGLESTTGAYDDNYAELESVDSKFTQDSQATKVSQTTTHTFTHTTKPSKAVESVVTPVVKHEEKRDGY